MFRGTPTPTGITLFPNFPTAWWQTDRAGSGERVIAFVVRARSALQFGLKGGSSSVAHDPGRVDRERPEEPLGVRGRDRNARWPPQE